MSQKVTKAAPDLEPSCWVEKQAPSAPKAFYIQFICTFQKAGDSATIWRDSVENGCKSEGGYVGK